MAKFWQLLSIFNIQALRTEANLSCNAKMSSNLDIVSALMIPPGRGANETRAKRLQTHSLANQFVSAQAELN